MSSSRYFNEYRFSVSGKLSFCGYQKSDNSFSKVIFLSYNPLKADIAEFRYLKGIEYSDVFNNGFRFLLRILNRLPKIMFQCNCYYVGSLIHK